MTDKLLVVMMTIDPNDGSQVSAALFQATVAASMEYDVEVILTGSAKELAFKGVAERVTCKAEGSKSAYDLIREAFEAGVKFKVSMLPHEAPAGELIPEVEDTVGGAYVISEAMDDNTVTLSY